MQQLLRFRGLNKSLNLSRWLDDKLAVLTLSFLKVDKWLFRANKVQ
jgi:hypothetical protein